LKIGPVRVPIPIADGIDRDERHAGFHQPPGEEAVLGEGNGAVQVACFLRLLVEVEGVLAQRGGEELMGSLGIAVPASRPAGSPQRWPGDVNGAGGWS
jgi:hypothetical protein